MELYDGHAHAEGNINNRLLVLLFAGRIFSGRLFHKRCVRSFQEDCWAYPRFDSVSWPRGRCSAGIAARIDKNWPRGNINTNASVQDIPPPLFLVLGLYFRVNLVFLDKYRRAPRFLYKAFVGYQSLLDVFMAFGQQTRDGCGRAQGDLDN